ncbi:MAG: glutathione peroxidase [Planctomycetes bacterium]|nr:glutathione peroxidase [Planctomycetota bacterium]
MNRLSRLAMIVLAIAAAPALVLLAQGKETPKEEKPAVKEAAKAELPEDSLFKLKVKNIDGKDVELKDYQGKVALVVNVASKCGLTPQYKGLEKLYTDLKDKGFVILGFPSNDFGGQEPGTAEEIKKLCTDTYGVTFPMFEKLQTKAGEGQSEVYKNLQKQSAELPKWNFAKYLVGKDGKVIKFFDSRVKPDDADLRKAIDAALAADEEAAPEETKPESKEEKPAGK